MTTQTLPCKAKLTILRAEHMGMCFGVRDAIALAQAGAAAGPVTVLGELVHNAAVLSDLEHRGVRFAEEPDWVETPAAIITAHGASDKARQRTRSAGLQVSDATCPLVHLAHAKLRGLVREGYHPVVIGRPGHVEVRGLTEDLDECDVILNEEGIAQIRPRPAFGVVAQTTQPIARVRALVDLLQDTFPGAEVRFEDTVCQPTKQRQSAAVHLAKQSDVVIVIGGANSNNTAELARTCARHCPEVHHVQGPAEVRGDWLPRTGTVGITAGTSTPDFLIEAVAVRMRELAERGDYPPDRSLEINIET